MLKMSELQKHDIVIPKHDHAPVLYAGSRYKVLDVEFNYKEQDYVAYITTEIFGRRFKINKRNFNRFNTV